MLAALMLLSLTACHASSSSSSTVTVTTSKTDENGNTTTNTTTGEVGVTVGTDGISANHSLNTETTEDTELPSEDELVAMWYETYSGGAIGENADGDRFLFAYDDPESMRCKAQYVLDHDYGGVFYWEHKCDDTGVLLSALYDVLTGLQYEHDEGGGA